MLLTAKKTKDYGENLWYQLWLHPECEYKDELLRCGKEAAEAYTDVEFYPEACIFCEYDSQQRIFKSGKRNKTIMCSMCPLVDDENQCCHGYYRKWALTDDIEERKIYAKAILDLIRQWDI